jgi:molecular chaperone GrpE
MGIDMPEQTTERAPGAATAPGAGSAATGAAADGAHGEAPEQGAGRGASVAGGVDERGEDAGARGSSDEASKVRADGGPAGGDAVNEIEGDLDELVAVSAKRDEYLALAQRTQADFENYRRRVARESALAQERGVVKLAKELLPALDNLDRALESAEEDDPLLEGVRLVREEIASALGRAGIESFSPTGETFDPSLHEAMAHQPVDGVPSGAVAEVYQPGYRLGEHVIRPARVVVAA